MVEETPEQARQGQKGKPVAIVLLASLALGLVALIALVLWALSGEEPGPVPAQTGSLPPLEGPVRAG